MVPSLPEEDELGRERRERALGGQQLIELDPVMMEKIQVAFDDQAGPGFRSCVEAFLGRVDASGDSASLQVVDLELVITVESRDGKATVMNPDSLKWPERLDAPARQCLVNAFDAIEIQTDSFDYKHDIVYPLRMPIPGPPN